MSKLKTLAIVMSTALVAATAGGLVIAHATAVDNTIHGCFDKTTGSLRVLTDTSPTCINGEEPLTWNDEQPVTRWFEDHDGDGYGDWYNFVDSPAQPPGFAASNSDCNDHDPTINPGAKTDPGPGDWNCNGVEAEDQIVTWYRDHDGDGWGSTRVTVRAPLSAQPIGYVARGDDCDDTRASIHPYQPKCHGDGDIDQDGHKAVSFTWTDSFGRTQHGDDCDDTNPNEYPGNTQHANGYGWDMDCDDTTGGVVGYDPQFLDPRSSALDWISSGFRRWRGDPQHLYVSRAGGGGYDCFFCLDNDQAIDRFPTAP